MPYLLDTNTCIDALRHHPNVVKRLSGVLPGDCAVSTVTTFELFTGVEKCISPATERAKVELLMNVLREIPFDGAAAREASRIRATLEARGEMIGPYDLLLAGHALTGGFTLVTANTGEFQRVAKLAVENWRL